MADSLTLISAGDIATLTINATGGTVLVTGKNHDTTVIGLPPAVVNTLLINTLQTLGVEGTIING